MLKIDPTAVISPLADIEASVRGRGSRFAGLPSNQPT